MSGISVGIMGSIGIGGGGGGGNVTTALPTGLGPAGTIPMNDTLTNIKPSPITFVGNNISMGAVGGIITSFPFHIVSTGAAPIITAGAGLGVGGTATISGNDIRGVIQLNFKVGIPGVAAIITFNTPYLARPIVVITYGTDPDLVFLTGSIFIDDSGVTVNKFSLNNSFNTATNIGTMSINYFVIG